MPQSEIAADDGHIFAYRHRRADRIGGAVCRQSVQDRLQRPHRLRRARQQELAQRSRIDRALHRAHLRGGGGHL